MGRVMIAAVLAGWMSLGSAQTYTPGETYFGTSGYIEYIAGNLPLVFSAPHGGTLKPSSIPVRTSSACQDPSFATGADVNTAELTRNVAFRFRDATGGKWPHVIINRLHRDRLDANRDKPQAACGNAAAELAWDEFHGYIEHAIGQITVTQGRGFYTDMHGHGHPARRIEAGYNLSATKISQTDAVLDTYGGDSSLRAFDALSLMPFSALIRDLGGRLTGAALEASGRPRYPVVPAWQDYTVEIGEAYFSGGYNTQRHSCPHEADLVCGVQLEHHRIDLRDTAANRTAYATALVPVYIDYLAQFGIVIE